MVRVSVRAQNKYSKEKSNGIPRTATIVHTEGPCVIFGKYFIELGPIFHEGFLASALSETTGTRHELCFCQVSLLPNSASMMPFSPSWVQSDLLTGSCAHVLPGLSQTVTENRHPFWRDVAFLPTPLLDNFHLAPFLKKLLNLLLKSYVHK